jgi:Carboxypeptidase regulatory-like domain/TonB dependent receptor
MEINCLSRVVRAACTVLCLVCVAISQTETATVSGIVSDSSGSVVSAAEVDLQNVERGTTTRGTTNSSGFYIFYSVQPGQYHITVRKAGFRQVDFLGPSINVQDHIEQNFSLQVGSVSESITIESRAPLINTQDATVSTVVDRNFVENLPMNGRSFQTLIQLTPGIVLTPTNNEDRGQFSVNGQRSVANYWMVDGVGANIGIGGNGNPGNGLAGALGSFSAQGGTASLVSIDAMQEFRIQTSTFAPEFGRTPGGQISIVTRSGANQWHGSAFDYFRNDVLDANDWFANSVGLAKPEERQNDFGGTLGGPIVKDNTFFFFSYEGLRLRLPQVGETTVPDVAARQNAGSGLQPYLNAFPLPNGTDDTATGIAQFNASFSNKSTLDSYSIRIDRRVGSQLSLFGRYAYSPSELVPRGGSAYSLNLLNPVRVTTETVTVGGTWLPSTAVNNDIRFNYSRVKSDVNLIADTFGGAIPLESLPLPSSFSAQNAAFCFVVFSLNGNLCEGNQGRNIQRQANVLDNLSMQRSSHSLKFGIDFRRLWPETSAPTYQQVVEFGDVPSASAGNVARFYVTSGRPARLLFRNLGAFAQDTWRVTPPLTLTYGVRWDLDFAPAAVNGPNISAVNGFNLNNLTQLALAPIGTPPFKTTYGNVAPRVGIAYQLSQMHDWQAVLRAGFGVFYDLATSESGNLALGGVYPFGGFAFSNCCNLTFPLQPQQAAPPAIVPPGPTDGAVLAFDPNLKLPYTLEWSVAIEQVLGQHQTATISYVGATARRLMQTANVTDPSPNLAQAVLTTNAGTSDYDSLQVQFQRRLSDGLQALASYTWSHSIDVASAGSYAGNGANALVPSAQLNRGPSDFDIRHGLSVGVTYDIPTPKTNLFARALLNGWSLESVIQARSASPINVWSYSYNGHYFFSEGGYSTQVRPDVVSGQPFYLYGPQYPGGKAINSSAFTAPPIDVNGNLLRQGNLSRNALRGFGTAQWDFALHRDLHIRESLRLQFRAEMFNLLNHPNFGPPDGILADPTFGRSTQMLAASLAGGQPGSGSFSPLYQVGGPRSIQLALKIIF